MLLNRFARICLGSALVALLFLGGCRSASKDRIRVLEAEKAEWAREKSDLQHQNAKLRGDLLQAESRAESAEARASSTEARMALMANQARSEDEAVEDGPTFDTNVLAQNLTNKNGVQFKDPGDGTAMIVLASDVSFKAGRADLSPAAERALREVAGALKSTPGIARVRVEGHTDSDPIVNSGWPSNEALSLARASKVQKFLIHHGISGEVLSVSGFGASRPIASNKTTKGKAANRRVEIVVVGS